MLIPFGILSAAGAGGVAGDYELIESVILGTATSSVTFSSLATYASTYKHLQIRYTAKDSQTAAGNDSYIALQFNGDTGSNYSVHFLQGSGTSVGSGAANSRSDMYLHLATVSADDSIFAAGVIDILDSFSASKYTTIKSFNGFAGNRVRLVSGLWMNTASLTSIEIKPQTPNLKVGSRFSLYGIR